MSILLLQGLDQTFILSFFQYSIKLFTPDGQFNIYNEKYEFGMEDFIAYVGGYLVSY